MLFASSFSSFKSFLCISYIYHSQSSTFYHLFLLQTPLKDLQKSILQMVKKVMNINHCDEIAPSLLIPHHHIKNSYSSFKLEPIIEEEPQNFEFLHKSFVVSVIPVIFSGLLYLFLYREIV